MRPISINAALNLVASQIHLSPQITSADGIVTAYPALLIICEHLRSTARIDKFKIGTLIG